MANTPISSINSLFSIGKSVGTTGSVAASGVKAAEFGIAHGLGSGVLGPVAGLGSAGPAVSAGLGLAVSIGPLSVPQAWTAALPPSAVSTPAGALSTTGVSAAAGGAPTGVPPVMPLGGMGARSFNASPYRYVLRPSVLPRSPSAG
jgi:PPE-repeat protein